MIPLQQARGPKKIDLAHTLGVSASELSHRLSGRTCFRAHEVALLALLYKLPTDVFLLHVPARDALLEDLGRELVAKAR